MTLCSWLITPPSFSSAIDSSNIATELVDRLAHATSSMSSHLMKMLRGVENELETIVGWAPASFRFPCANVLCLCFLFDSWHPRAFSQVRKGHQDLLSDVNMASMAAGELAIATAGQKDDEDADSDGDDGDEDYDDAENDARCVVHCRARSINARPFFFFIALD